MLTAHDVLSVPYSWFRDLTGNLSLISSEEGKKIPILKICLSPEKVSIGKSQRSLQDMAYFSGQGRIKPALMCAVTKQPKSFTWISCFWKSLAKRLWLQVADRWAIMALWRKTLSNSNLNFVVQNHSFLTTNDTKSIKKPTFKNAFSKGHWKKAVSL